MSTLTAKDVEHVFESLRKGLVPERGIDAFAVVHLHGGSQEVSYANTGLVGNKTSVANYMRENLDENTLKQVAGFGRHADGNK